MNHHPLHAKALQRVNSAQTAFDNALETGRDTTQARADLRAAHAELLAIEAQVRQEALRAGSEQAIEAEAGALVQAALETLEGLVELPALPAPNLPLDVAIQLARARHQAADHAALVQAHQDRLNTLHARMGALPAERERLIKRCPEGGFKEADRRRLDRIDGDLAGLRDLIERTEQEAPPPDTSRLWDWEGYWSQLLAEARGARLTALADALAFRLGAVVRRLQAEGRVWRRSPEVVVALAGVCR